MQALSAKPVLRLWTRVLGWVLVRGFKFGYHNKETVLLTIDTYYGSLN